MQIEKKRSINTTAKHYDDGKFYMANESTSLSHNRDRHTQWEKEREVELLLNIRHNCLTACDVFWRTTY